MLFSLEDPLLQTHAKGLSWWLCVAMAGPGRAHAPSLGGLAVRRAQIMVERLHSRIRRDLLKQDEYLDTALAFSGRFE